VKLEEGTVGVVTPATVLILEKPDIAVNACRDQPPHWQAGPQVIGGVVGLPDVGEVAATAERSKLLQNGVGDLGLARDGSIATGIEVRRAIGGASGKGYGTRDDRGDKGPGRASDCAHLVPPNG
jgi:hypothetical protein